jgi:Carboxypeptidase regulatory-like domain/TonB dependent receptor-like, beta-barrel
VHLTTTPPTAFMNGTRGSNRMKTMATIRIRRLARLATGVLMMLVLAVAVPAAAQTTTGSIRGRVVNQEGQPVDAVLFTARNIDTGLSRTALSSTDGLFVIHLLPPGTYRVSTEMIGFATESRDVRVAIGSAATINFDLRPQAIQIEGITVAAARPPIDAAQGGVVQSVSTTEIEELPSLGRDFTDFINLSGLVAPDPGVTTGGQFSIAGMRASQTSIQIDGVDANNSFFGENRGGSRIPFVFSLESLREFQIITNGFDVEHGRFGGGIINVLTRGGTNDVKASVYGNFRNDKLTAAPFIQDPSNPEITTNYEVEQFAGSISGPIRRDRAFFFLSADGQRRREPQLPLTQGRYAPGAERADPVVFAEMGQFFDILENQYGITNAASGYAPFETSNDALTLFGRLDFNLGDKHRLSLRHNFSTFKNGNEWNGIFDFAYGHSRAETLKDKSHSFVTELQSVFNETSFNVLRFQFSQEKRPRQATDLRPALTVNLSNGQQARYGGSFAAFNNNLEETKFQLVDNYTRVVGDHTFKVGGNFLLTDYLNQFQAPGSQSQGAGEYRFANIDDFRNFRPSSYFRPFEEGGGIARAKFGVDEWAIYAQDEWQVTPKLTATLGLRYDQQSFRDSPTPIVNVERAFGYQTGFAPTDANNISPRLSLAYDLNGDGRRVLRGGAGVFYGSVPGVVGGNVLQTERPILEVNCNGSIIDGDPDAPPSPQGFRNWPIDGFGNPTTCADAGATGVPVHTLWGPDFQLPQHFKANIGYETLLGSKTQVSVDFLFSQSNSMYTVRNLNLRDPQFTLDGEGGRRIFTPIGQFDPTGGNAAGAKRNLEFGDVLVNYNDGRARSFNFSLNGQHRLTDAIQLRGSYTWTKAWDNSPYSCCTASEGYTSPSIGIYGPNDVGGIGDYDKGWGVSSFSREHTFIFSGFADLPWGVQLGAIWRSQSGRPWSVVGNADLNGDGVLYNDRPFIFAPADLPVVDEADRQVYADILKRFPCIGDHVGKILERNTCRFPWTHSLDMRLSKSFNTINEQRFELQIDAFNVLNGIGRLLCNEQAADADLTKGVCGWGRWTGVFGADTDLLSPTGFDRANRRILYNVNDTFGTEDLLGANLLLQFQVQVGLRYHF